MNTHTNVVEPIIPPKKEEYNITREAVILYNSEPQPIMNGGLKGIRDLKNQGSEIWGEKYVGDM